MSNIIPPLVSHSPPPMVADESDTLDEDEFGDFTAVRDYSLDGYSLPSSPLHETSKSFQSPLCSSINNNNSNTITKHSISSSSSSSDNQLLDSKHSILDNSSKDMKYNIFCDKKSVDDDDDDVNSKTVDNEIITDIKSIALNPNEIVPKSETNTRTESETKEINPPPPTTTEAEEIEFGDFECQTIECNKENDCKNVNEVIENELNEETSQQNDFDDFVCNSVLNVETSKINQCLVNDECKEENNDEEECLEEDFKNFECNTVVDNEDKCLDGSFREESNSNHESLNGNKNEVINEEETNKSKEDNDCTFSVDFTKVENQTKMSDEKPQEMIKNINTFEENTEPLDDFDDFGDFNDYSTCEISVVEENVQKSVHEVETVLRNTFPDSRLTVSDFEAIDFTVNDLFKQLQDIETTHALHYQWSNSESQKLLLKSLNIDSRNILFGPRWNASMPRFAANLGFAPLEPVRSEFSTNNLSQSSSDPVQSDIPAAKFDWISAGLTNPLDYSQANTMLLDLEQLVTSLDISHLTVPQTSNDTHLDFDSWDYWLQTQQSETVKPKTPEEKNSIINVNNMAQLDLSIFGSDNESVNSLKFIETPIEIENELKSDPDNQSLDKISTENIQITPDEMEFTDFHTCSSKLEETETTWTTTNMEPVPLRETHISNRNEKVEDDFTEFHMSLPQQPEPVIKSVAFEPLKPIVLENVTIPTEINWPEPGIVNEFQFTYTKPVAEDQSQIPQPKTKPIIESKTSPDDDDWSDFVSATKPTVQKLETSNSFNNLFQNILQKPVQRLELSVPNLPLTHPVVPLGTNVNSVRFPGQSYQFNKPFSSNFVVNGPTNPFSSVQSVENTFRNMNESRPEQNDDDDWSDFVSGQPAPAPVSTITNGFQQLKSSNNWSMDSTPNIITNPVHSDFDVFQTYQTGIMNKTTGTTVQTQARNKNSVPTISTIPDLDFVTPRSKYLTKK